ncbi:MAG TPA: glycine zipper family protein [Dehalococcoidia bacterium]|nr:glycine zipper family protein [Dehalococcoidia bacterium]
MKANSRWYEETIGKLEPYKSSLSKREQKKYQLDLLERVSRRVAEFNEECGECQLFQQEITAYVNELGNMVHLSDNTRRKQYRRRLKQTVRHLQSQHKLVPKGHHVGLWISIGTGIGVAIGAAMGKTGVGIPIGIAIGVAIGMMLDARAKKEDRVI